MLNNGPAKQRYVESIDLTFYTLFCNQQ